MDKSRASKSVVVKHFSNFTIRNYPNDVSMASWPNPNRKNFGRPVKAVSRKGKDSPWRKGDK